MVYLISFGAFCAEIEMISGLRPTCIILISFYCFLVGLFLLSMSVNAIFSDNGITDFIMWLPVGAGLALTAILISTGVGILYYIRLCWKILFFFLMVYVTNVAALIFVLF